VTVTGTLKDKPWHPFGAVCARSMTPGTTTVVAGAFAGSEMFAVVGAFASTLTCELAQTVGAFDNGVPQLYELTVTGNGFGLAIVSDTADAGPPGYNVEDELGGITAAICRLFAIAAVAPPEPDPFTVHTA
jgi:hypothetical protein